MFAVDVVRKEHRLYLFGFIILIEKFTQAAGQKRNKLRDFCAGDAPKPLAGAKQIAPSFQARRVDLRRRLHKKRLQVSRQLFQLIVDLHESRCIFGGYLGEFLPRPFTIGPPRNDVAVGKGNLNRRITGNHPQAVIGQPEFRNHLRPKHARDIRSRGDATPRRDLLRHATTPDNVAAL